MSQYTSLTIDRSSEGKSEAQQGITTTSLTSNVEIEDHPDKKVRSAGIEIWLALLINIIIICILIAAVFVPFKLTNSGILSTRTKSIYVTALTILATLCAAFTSSQIRHLWLRHVDTQLASPGVDFSDVNSKWRTTIGVASLLESLQRWHIMGTFLISGLITTAIVAGLSTSLAQSQKSYSYYLADPYDYLCASSSSTPISYNWQLPNGSYYIVNPNLDFCPGSVAMTLLGAINTFDPGNYGYADAGVAVHSSAFGAPASIYSAGSDNNDGFNSSISAFGQSLLSTTQCAPVMTKNPITCTTAGNATFFGFEGTNYLQMKSPDQTCVNSIPVGNVSNTQAYSVGAICPFGSLGQVTIVLAGLEGAAIYLAEAIGDSTWLDNFDASSASPTPYGVTCTVDMAPALDYRELHLTLQQSTGSTGAYSRSLSATSSDSCTPIPSSPFSGSETSNLDKLIAIASFAAYQPVVVPWADWARPLTIQKTTDGGVHTHYIRTGPYAFANSKNALEDVLGLTSALVLSRATMTGASGQIEYVGKSTVLYTRAGTGEKWALVYIVPSLLVVFVIVVLMMSTRKKSTGFSSEQLSDLVGLRLDR